MAEKKDIITDETEVNNDTDSEISNEFLKDIQKNVIIFGETGTGKSSVTNMLAGKKVAEVSNGAAGCTFEYKKYSIDGYNYYDTIGLNEGSFGIVDAKQAMESLISLLKSLENGANLLIMTMKRGRIKDSMQQNYNLFVKEICDNKVPVILVVTHCDSLANMSKWWDKNKKSFDSYKMEFKDTVCVCASNGEGCEPELQSIKLQKFNESRAKLIESIEKHSLKYAPRIEFFLDWLVITARRVLNFLGQLLSLPQIPYWPEFKDYIKGILDCSDEKAVDLSNKIIDMSEIFDLKDDD